VTSSAPGSSASGAAKNAQTAKTAASAVSGSVQALKSDIDKGDLQGALTILGELKESLATTEANVNQIPALVKFTAIQDKLNDTVSAINTLASSKGWPNLLNFGSTQGVGKVEGELDVKAIGEYMKHAEDAQGALLFMQKMMDETRYQPVITEQLRGE